MRRYTTRLANARSAFCWLRDEYFRTVREASLRRKGGRREAAARTIEIGLAYGISALFICEGLLANGADVRHVALDPYQEKRFANCGLPVHVEAEVGGLVEYHAAVSEILLSRFLADGRRFDLTFVDGNHRFDGMFLDLIYLGRLVRPGGIIVVDDYQLRSVARAVAFCANNLGWMVEEVSPDDAYHHWAVRRTARVPLQRNYDHYVDF